MTHASSTSSSFVERVADRFANEATGKQAMIRNNIALGCMVAVALPGIFKALHGMWGGVFGEEMSHTQRLQIERVIRDMDRRGMGPGEQRAPVRDGGHPDPYPRRMR